MVSASPTSLDFLKTFALERPKHARGTHAHTYLAETQDKQWSQILKQSKTQHKKPCIYFRVFPSLIILLDYYLFFSISQQHEQFCFCSVSYHFSPDSRKEWSRPKTAILCSRQLSLFLLKSKVICGIWEKALESRSDVLWPKFSQKLLKFPILWHYSFLAFSLQDAMSHPLVESLFFPNDTKCALE